MGKWNKIDWYCADCGEYWMTTENCSPCAKLSSWCHCSCRTGCKHDLPAQSSEDKGSDSLAVAKCHVCSQDLLSGKDLCVHVETRSLAT